MTRVGQLLLAPPLEAYKPAEGLHNAIQTGVCPWTLGPDCRGGGPAPARPAAQAPMLLLPPRHKPSFNPSQCTTCYIMAAARLCRPALHPGRLSRAASWPVPAAPAKAVLLPSGGRQCILPHLSRKRMGPLMVPPGSRTCPF